MNLDHVKYYLLLGREGVSWITVSSVQVQSIDWKRPTELMIRDFITISEISNMKMFQLHHQKRKEFTRSIPLRAPRK